ncbi:MAG: hypothetical protein ABL996_12380 [Micropepsaceae bacterium]
MAVKLLKSYWLAFPDLPQAPFGMGVTARSLQDAFALLEANGYEYHRLTACLVVREVSSPDDIDKNNVSPNAGPIVVRGVWYPALNIGFGAPYGGKDPF